jgi:negative regulator of flagellin synthesis FlgM
VDAYAPSRDRQNLNLLKHIEDKIMLNQISDPTPLDTTESEEHLNSSFEINKILSEGSTSFDDTIYLGTTSKQLEAIKKLIDKAPEVNEALILYFKAEIDLGNYTIDSTKIAEKMVHYQQAK